MEERRSENTTLCYIEKENCYLMMHRVKKSHDVNKDKWVGVGGHFEAGESPEECLLREVKEETNLDICEDDLSLRGVTNDFYSQTQKHYITLHFFCTKFVGTPQGMEKEKCVCWKWFDVNNLPENLLLSNQNFIKKCSLECL